MMVMTVTGCIIKLRSKVDNCFTIRSTCNMQLRNGLSWKRNHLRWLFPIQPYMMSSAYPQDVHGGFMVTCRRGRTTLWLRSLLGTHACFQKLLWSTETWRLSLWLLWCTERLWRRLAYLHFRLCLQFPIGSPMKYHMTWHGEQSRKRLSGGSASTRILITTYHIS